MARLEKCLYPPKMVQNGFEPQKETLNPITAELDEKKKFWKTTCK